MAQVQPASDPAVAVDAQIVNRQTCLRDVLLVTSWVRNAKGVLAGI